MLNYFFIPPICVPQDEKVIWQKPQTTQNCQRELAIMQKKYASLKKKCQDLEKENDSLKIEIQDLEAKIPEIRKRKIKRRPESELVKNFKCPFSSCFKEYASELALNLHMKIKHNAGTKKERIEIIGHLIEAAQKGDPLPEIEISLPPNYLQEFQKAMEVQPNQKNSISDWQKYQAENNQPEQKSSQSIL